MDSPYISDELAIGFYRWAQEDFRREIREGFPFLHRIQEKYLVFRQLPTIESLPQEDQYILASGLLKRFHIRAARILGEEIMTPEEVELYRRYDSAIDIWKPEELELNQQMANDRRRFKLNRKRFGTLLKEALNPILGDDIEFSDHNTWRYWTPVGKLTVFTSVDIGGRYHQLTYRHGIASREQGYLAVVGVSILGWLGIGGGPYWDFLTNDDTPEAAQTLALFCSHFFEALRNLVNDSERGGQ